MEDRSHVDKQPKEIKLWAPNICSRNLWVRKLQKTKKKDFGFNTQTMSHEEQQLYDNEASIAPALVDKSYSDHFHGGIIRLEGKQKVLETAMTRPKTVNDIDEEIILNCKANYITPQNQILKSILSLTPQYLCLTRRQRFAIRHPVTVFTAVIESSISSEFVLVVPNGNNLRISGMD